jgi:hypothetical protein
MKAIKVLEFEQGKNPYDTMGLGKYDNDYDFENPHPGDIIILIENVYWIYKIDIFKELMTESDLLRHLDDNPSHKKGTEYEYTEDDVWESFDAEPFNRINFDWVAENTHIFKKLR